MKFNLNDFLELDTNGLFAVNGGFYCNGSAPSTNYTPNTYYPGSTSGSGNNNGEYGVEKTGTGASCSSINLGDYKGTKKTISR